MKMKQKRVVKNFSMPEEELIQAVDEAMSGVSSNEMATFYEESIKDFEPDRIVQGRILNISSDSVIIDVGYKSEGEVPLAEFDSPPKLGDDIEVLLETVEDESGEIVLSKKKADRIRGWERLISTKKEGDVVEGKVIRKIKGGLLLDVGVPVFLPASQIDIRRTGDISDYIGQQLKAQIIKIDEARMNIVVSRRRLIEEERRKMKEKLLQELEEGQIVSGIVKNIADFGVFVDLGGIDGLLHITDMSWGRISHPQEMVNIDDRIEVKILKLDRKRERIALGLKQKTESPWKNVEEKYPIDSRVKGKVVNVMNYGAFVKLEEGIEGLVHISEMSWTRRINHPSEMVNIGDDVDVVVLDINKEKQEISLGMKQVEVNPWSLVEGKYPVNSTVKGRVRNLTNYGAFIELEEGIDGLLHISDMSWTKKISHPSEMLKKNDIVEAMVLEVDQNQKRVALGMKQLQADPWEKEIPDRYKVDDIVTGRVTKLTNFGVFVELEPDLEGLLHISELTDRKIKSPDEVVSVGDTVEIKILRLDKKERKIGLSLVRARPGEDGEDTKKPKEKRGRKGPESSQSRSESREEKSRHEAKERPRAHVKETAKPQVQQSAKPQAQEAPAPQTQEAPAPQAQEAPAPQAQEAPAPQAQEAPAPQAQEAPAPQAQEAPAPQAQEAPAPQAQEAPAPQAQEAPAPQAQEAPAPQAQEAPAPQAQEAPAPQAQEAPAPQAQEAPAPQAQEAPAPQAQEAPAPQAQEAPAPQAQEAPAPQAQEAPAPQTQEAPAPQTQEAPAPQAQEEAPAPPAPQAQEAPAPQAQEAPAPQAQEAPASVPPASEPPEPQIQEQAASSEEKGAVSEKEHKPEGQEQSEPSK